MGSGLRAVVYVRASAEKQVAHGLILEAQRAKLTAYVALYELDLVAVEVDAVVSAKTLQRPALQRALRCLNVGEADALLVVKLDSLSRSVRDLGALVETYFLAGKWSLMSVSELIDTRTAAGRMVLNVLVAVSQWECAADGVHLEPAPDEQRFIRDARDLKAAGLSLRTIGARTWRHGRRTCWPAIRRSRPWSIS